MHVASRATGYEGYGAEANGAGGAAPGYDDAAPAGAEQLQPEEDPELESPDGRSRKEIMK